MAWLQSLLPLPESLLSYFLSSKFYCQPEEAIPVPDAVPTRENAVRRPTNLIELLQRAAQLWPEHGIHIPLSLDDDDASFLTYADLWDEASRNASILETLAIAAPKQPVLIYLQNPRDGFVWFWSTILAGIVPALLPPLKSDHGTMVRELEHISGLLDKPVVLTSVEYEKNFQLGDLFQVRSVESISGKGVKAKHSYSANLPASLETQLATLLFTSGSTGHSKAVEFTHAQLIASSRLKTETNGMDSSKTFFSWISLDHSVSICELHLHAMYAGANQVALPPGKMVLDPFGFWHALSKWKVSYTFAPNSFLAAAVAVYNEIDDGDVRKTCLDFSALGILFCGGEANKVSTLHDAAQVLCRHGAHDHAVTPVYGLSETCSALFYNRYAPAYDVKHNYTFASIGKALPGHDLRIVDEMGTKVQDGGNGALQLRGPTIFRRYFNNPSATGACMTSDDWFDTGDVGHLDAGGNLCIVGRTKEILLINGQNYSSFELEYAIEAAGITGLAPGFTASFTAWIEGTTSSTEELVVLFNPADNVADGRPELWEMASQIRSAAVSFCGKRPFDVIPLPRSELPKSSIGKLSRAKLKEAFLADRFDAYRLHNTLSNGACDANSQSPIQRIVQEAIGEVLLCSDFTVSPDIMISSVGIDSLGYLRMKSLLERRLHRPDGSLTLLRLLECRTFRDLEQYLLEIPPVAPPPYDPVVHFRTAGSRTPLVLLAGANGEGMIFLPLIARLEDRPILALRPRGFNPGESPFQSIEEMADSYAAGLKAHLPHGPYCILGVCLGGTVGFELAKRLEARGDSVLFTGVLANPPDMARYALCTSEPHLLGNLLEMTGVLTTDECAQLVSALPPSTTATTDGATSALVAEAHAKIPPERLLAKGFTADYLERWMYIIVQAHRTARFYRPAGQVRSLDVFHTPSAWWVLGLSDKVWMEEWLGEWRTLVRPATDLQGGEGSQVGGLRFHRLDAEYDDVVNIREVELLHKVISQALEAREREAGVDM